MLSAPSITMAGRELRPGDTVTATDIDDASANIYANLAAHQRAEEWNGRELMAVLQMWVVRFIVEFKLDISEVALCLERLGRNTYGHFRPGHNGFGLRGEIALNTLYLVGNRPFWKVLGTLLHELIHAWQEVHGTPSGSCHHNTEFRHKAADYGLIVDPDGCTEYARESPFKDLLAAYGIDTSEEMAKPSGSVPPSRSRLAKWSCGCTNVRVGVSDFAAVCLKCSRQFVRC